MGIPSFFKKCIIFCFQNTKADYKFYNIKSGNKSNSNHLDNRIGRIDKRYHKNKYSWYNMYSK